MENQTQTKRQCQLWRYNENGILIKVRNKEGGLLSPLIFNIVLKILTNETDDKERVHLLERSIRGIIICTL